MQSKIVIITGAAGSIGQAISQRFLDQGDIVVALDINSSGLKKMRRELHCDKNKIYTFEVNVTKYKDVSQIINVIHKEIGFAEVLINNAGGNFSTLFSKTTKKEWNKDLALNLNASFNTCKEILKQMKKHMKGCIVNIGSVNALSIYGDPGYSVAKAGLVHLTRFIAVEYGSYGIRANTICPGTVRTNIWSDVIKQKPDLYQRLSSLCPLQQVSEAEDIANLVIYICSKQAKMITGSTLVIDGGLNAGIRDVMEHFVNVPIGDKKSQLYDNLRCKQKWNSI